MVIMQIGLVKTGGKNLEVFCDYIYMCLFIRIQAKTAKNTQTVKILSCCLFSLMLSSALLPPHMRPAAAPQSSPYSEPLDCQTISYDLPKNEPDLKAQPWDPNYSYSAPEGSGVEVKLSADPSRVLAQTPGEETTLFLLFVFSFCLKQI